MKEYINFTNLKIPSIDIKIVNAMEHNIETIENNLNMALKAIGDNTCMLLDVVSDDTLFNISTSNIETVKNGFINTELVFWLAREYLDTIKSIVSCNYDLPKQNNSTYNIIVDLPSWLISPLEHVFTIDARYSSINLFLPVKKFNGDIMAIYPLVNRGLNRYTSDMNVDAGSIIMRSNVELVGAI